MPLRRKGLAILAVLGVRGDVSRDALASLLWENGRARSNLRVELHRLSDAVGAALFEPGEDPLRLPQWVEVEGLGGGGEPLGGLDGLSPDLDDWIEATRGGLDGSELENRRATDLGQGLALELRPPFLVVVRARPGEVLGDFKSGLAEALHLPLVDGCGGPARAIHVVSAPYPEDWVQNVLEARDGVWVVRVPSYGEDPRPVLELRNAYDASRARYVELPAVSWQDARSNLLHDLPFVRAAEAYLWSGGNSGFLRELARMKWARDDDGSLAIPQRVRAAYALEIRYAHIEARLALERLSVHPGPLTDSLVDVLEARDAVDELERRGWLVFDGTWRFRDAESRTVIYRSLQPGRRASYHRNVALQMALEGSWLSEIYHRIASGQRVEWSDNGGAPQGLARDAVRAALGLEVTGPAARTVSVSPGSEQALLESGRHGEGVEGYGADWIFVKIPGQGPSAVSFELPGERCLLRLRGRCWAQAPLGVGLTGQAVPLEIDLADHGRVVFLDGLMVPVVRDRTLLMPLPMDLDAWLLLPGAPEMRLVSRAEAAILELEVTVHEVASRVVAPPPPGDGAPRERDPDRAITAVDVQASFRSVGAITHRVR